jgi:hypothetical protein
VKYETSENELINQVQSQFSEACKWANAQKYDKAAKLLDAAGVIAEDAKRHTAKTKFRDDPEAQYWKEKIVRAKQLNAADEIKFGLLKEAQAKRKDHRFNESREILMTAALDAQPALLQLINDEMKLVERAVQDLHSARREYYTAQMALFVHCSNNRMSADEDQSATSIASSSKVVLPLDLLFQVVKIADRLFRNRKRKLKAATHAVTFIRRAEKSSSRVRNATGQTSDAVDEEEVSQFAPDGSNDYHCGLLYLMRRLFQCDLIPEQFWKGLFDVLKAFVDRASATRSAVELVQTSDDNSGGSVRSRKRTPSCNGNS